MSGYQIADEPAPSTFARFAVNPVFPMLAAMLGGVWIAWPWFAFNSFAVGSPTRRAELVWLAAALVALPLLFSALILARANGWLPQSAGPYAGLLLVVVKLAAVYAVVTMQSRTIEIYQYYGGSLANGTWVLVAAFLITNRGLLDGLPVLLRVTLQ